MTATEPKSPTTVIRAQGPQISQVVDILARAFDDDPALNWFVRRDAHRAAAIRRFFQMLSDALYEQQGENYLMSDVTGATMWLPPGVSSRVGLWETLRQIPAVVQIVRFRGLRRLLRVQAIVEQNHPHEPHYYLFGIGTHPELRGRGIGSQLMRPMLERADREGMPVYLENSKERNLPFYERHGFEVVNRVQFPDGGPFLWPMWREPR